MKELKKYFLLCLIVLQLQACTSFSVRIVGKIYDKETGRPLAGTTVNLLDGSDIKITGNDGFFEVFSETRPFQDARLLVTLDGYKPFQLKIKEKSNETSYIVKSGSIHVDFEEPVYPDPNNLNTFITGTSIEKWSEEFRTGDTLYIYLVREDLKAEIERNRQDLLR